MSFIRLPKHRYFNYQPLYYNENKERMQERYDRYGQREENSGTEDYKYYPGKYLRGKMRPAVYDSRRSSMKPSLSRVLKIALFLVVIILIYLFADKIFYLFY